MQNDSPTPVTPGEQTIKVLSAAPGTIAEKVLRAIASAQKDENSRYPRSFGPWWRAPEGEHVCEGVVRVLVEGQYISRPLTLVIGKVDDGERLKDAVGDRFSLKNMEVGVNLPHHRLRSAADALVAALCVHGTGWVDRSGQTHMKPWGEEPTSSGSSGKKKSRPRSDHSFPGHMEAWGLYSHYE